jgi:hypothetical protein
MPDGLEAGGYGTNYYTHHTLCMSPKWAKSSVLIALGDVMAFQTLVTYGASK